MYDGRGVRANNYFQFFSVFSVVFGANLSVCAVGCQEYKYIERLLDLLWEYRAVTLFVLSLNEVPCVCSPLHHKQRVKHLFCLAK